jgi:hypothetical protein
MSGTEPDDPDSSEGLGDLCERLTTSRPRPDSAFLDRLTRLLEPSPSGADGQRRVGAQIAAFAVAGLVLLTVAAAVTFL